MQIGRGEIRRAVENELPSRGPAPAKPLPNAGPLRKLLSGRRREG